MRRHLMEHSVVCQPYDVQPVEPFVRYQEKVCSWPIHNLMRVRTMLVACSGTWSTSEVNQRGSFAEQAI